MQALRQAVPLLHSSFAARALVKPNATVGKLGAMSRRAMSEAAAPNAAPEAAKVAITEAYSAPLSWAHWGMAGGLLTCIATVQLAMNTKDKKAKMDYMNLHKSVGVLMAGAVLGRVGLRLASKVPPGVPGPAIMQLAANASHVALYGFMVFMPASGIAMGYYGGKGLPFFGYTIPGAPKPNGAIAKDAFKYHKLVGQAFEYFVPVHVGGVAMHAVKGQNILTRVSPFATKALS